MTPTENRRLTLTTIELCDAASMLSSAALAANDDQCRREMARAKLHAEAAVQRLGMLIDGDETAAGVGV
jgi:hypothetical protein